MSIGAIKSTTEADENKVPLMDLRFCIQDARNKSLRYFSAECDVSISHALSSINDLLEQLKKAKPISGVTQSAIDECVLELQDEQYKAKAALIKLIKEKIGVVIMYNRDTNDLRWSTNLDTLHGYEFLMSKEEFDYININLARFDCSNSHEMIPVIQQLRLSYVKQTNDLFDALKKINT